MRTVKPILAVAMVVGVLTVAIAASAAIGNGSDTRAGGESGAGRGAQPDMDGAPHGRSHDGVTGAQPCGEIVEEEGPDGSVGYVPCDDPAPIEPRPRIVEPMPGMADVHARPFDAARVGDDGRTVSVDFVSGIEPCSVLDRVQVTYGAEAVTITLFEGYDPDSGDVACVDIGVFKRVMVTLDEPIADRVIVDGAAR